MAGSEQGHLDPFIVTGARDWGVEHSVTVVIPTVPSRRALHRRAVRSALEQSLVPAQVVNVLDQKANGPGPTRNRGLAEVQTPWVAFLDDDDLLLPSHLETCLRYALETNADLVYPWYRRTDGHEPFPGLYGHGSYEWLDPAWDAVLARGNFIPVTTLVRTDLLRDVGGFQVRQGGPVGSEAWEDWGAWMALREAGAHFAHVDTRTWVWNWRTDSYAGGAWRS